MSQNLVKSEGGPLQTASKYAMDEKFQEDLVSGGWMSRIQVCGGNSKAAMTGKVKVGNYAIVRGKDNFEDLGAVCDVVPLAYRPVAIDTSEGYLAVYDPKSEAFGDIRDRSKEQDSGCFWGPEFLVWLPSHKSFHSFGLFSTTARNVFTELRSLLPGDPDAEGNIPVRLVTLKSQMIQNKRNTWYGPVIVPSSQPISCMPPYSLMAKEIERFINPPEKDDQEFAPEDEVKR